MKKPGGNWEFDEEDLEEISRKKKFYKKIRSKKRFYKLK